MLDSSSAPNRFRKLLQVQEKIEDLYRIKYTLFSVCCNMIEARYQAKHKVACKYKCTIRENTKEPFIFAQTYQIISYIY